MIALIVGGSVMSIRQVSLEQSQIHQLIGSNQTLEFTVVSDPKIIAGGKISLIAKAKGVPVRVIGRASELLPSAKFLATGQLLESKEPRVAALFIIWKPFTNIKPPNSWQKQLGDIRAGLRVKSKDAPLIPGMVLGDTSLQSPEFSDAMRRSGLTHLTAVSGANFAIVSSFLLWVLQFPIRNIRIRLIITSIFLIAFIGLVRPSPSVLRAAAMAAVVIFARSHRERSDSLPALGFAIAIVVIADPWQSRDPGFALSVLATAGLLLIAPKIKAPSFIAEPIAASLLCAPIIVGLSGYLSISSVMANVLAAPFVAPITILGFIATLVPTLAPILLPPAKFFASIITKISFTAAQAPVIQVRSALLFSVIAIFLVLLRKHWPYLVIAILILSYVQRWPNNDWQIANCDVGQGDALVLKVGAHSGMLIDTGPDPKLINSCLKSLGISHIPLLILTHGHEDHIGGLTGALRNRQVDQVVSEARQGEILQVGQLKVEILWPDAGSHSFTEIGRTSGGEGSQINNQSIVALITAPDYTLLATGDIEPDAQRQISVRKVDFLKVAHHGSKYQDINFNKIANPELAIISVGKGNKYGHPDPETLALFKRALRTDELGAIAIDPKQFSISSSKVGVFGLPVLWRVA